VCDRSADPSGEIESSEGRRYCSQDRERGLQWIACTRHGRASGDHWSNYSDVSNYSEERELRFGLPHLRTSALPTIPKPHRCCLDCDIRQRTKQVKEIDLAGHSYHITSNTGFSDRMLCSAHNFPGEARWHERFDRWRPEWQAVPRFVDPPAQREPTAGNSDRHCWTTCT